MLRVVIDTNILINGSRDDFNYGNRIIEEIRSGKILAFANRATLKENVFLTSNKIQDKYYLNKLKEYFSKVTIVPELTKKLTVVEDQEDNKLLESAVSAQADYLVSSDRHLLKLEKYKDIQIVSPERFWTILQEDTGEGWNAWKKQFIQE